MVAPRYRSRTLRRVFVRTPGGRVVLHHKKRKPSKPQCAECGTVLSGVPNIRARQLHSLSKTAKRPERPYGGVLCSKCTRSTIIAKARSLTITA